MHQPPSATHRIHGLDTLRALAIVLVFMYHYMVFVSSSDTFGFLSRIGWVGVDLFFALSGYLIGNQILAGLRDGRGFSLTNFHAHRLLRTLPVKDSLLGLTATVSHTEPFRPSAIGQERTFADWQLSADGGIDDDWEFHNG